MVTRTLAINSRRNSKKEAVTIKEAYKYIAENNYFQDRKYSVLGAFSFFSYISSFFFFSLRKRGGKKYKTSDMNSIIINKCFHNQNAAHPAAVVLADPDPVAEGRFLCKN